MTPSEQAAIHLTEDQFWALERWISVYAVAAAMAPGVHDPAQLRSVRHTAYVALTGKEPRHD